MSSSAERRVENQFPQPARPPNSYDPSFQVQAVVEQSYYNNSVRHLDHIIPGEGRARDRLKAELEGIFTKLDNMGRFPDSEHIQSRGIDHDSSYKLERFKVRTVVAEEVVKEEDKK
ncbi:hypothetical protein QN277_021281 [Acacia crassicarpa]|uniref:Uncharacterized protein n=1 Tax=Acacia crassicarpa TaxID=499986 RepID=A0AAE1JRG9_9FABA|nr:hypothetical protein QN277_021281 [Acacia crassicarpa]